MTMIPIVTRIARGEHPGEKIIGALDLSKPLQIIDDQGQAVGVSLPLTICYQTKEPLK